MGTRATDAGSRGGSRRPELGGAPPCRDAAALLGEPGADRTSGQGRPARFGQRLEDLDWIDGFVRRIRPYVRVRLEDQSLIKLPNEAHQLNRTGLRILAATLQGRPVRQVALERGAAAHPERIEQIHWFFCDVRDLLAGRLGDGRGRAAVRVRRFRGSWTRYPVLSEIALTYRCNLACRFCYAGCGQPDASPGDPHREPGPWRRPWRRGGARPPRGELSAAEAKQAIDQIALVGRTPSLSFTGGEPTLRPELPELIAHARSRAMRVNLITNGIACADRGYAAALAEAGLHSAQVSLEGPAAAVHDRITQRPGSFAKTVRGVERLREAGLRVHTNTTICRENAGHLAEIVELVRSLELERLSMNHLIPVGSARLPRHAGGRIRYSELGPYVLQVKRRAREAGLAFHWYAPTPLCLFNSVAHGLGAKGCAACDGLIHVSPTGDVLPCSSFAHSVGNLLEEGLERVWFGPRAQWFKRKRQAPWICRLCPEFALCQGACPLYWSNMGRGELWRGAARRQLRRLGWGERRP